MARLAKLRQWGREIPVLRALFRNWPLAVRHHYEVFCPAKPEVITLRFRSGEVVRVDRGWIDVTVLKSIWGDRIYETFPGFAPEPGWVVLDLGAHKGGFALFAARAGAEVYALEPERHNLELLRANVARNPAAGGGRVHVRAGAVAGASGEGELIRRNSWAHGIETHPDDPAGLDREPVALVGLDELVAEAGGRVDLAKLDVEGAELAALVDASAETLARIGRIVLEYHAVGGKSDEEVGGILFDHLAGHGFRCRLYPYNTLFADRVEG